LKRRDRHDRGAPRVTPAVGRRRVEPCRKLKASGRLRLSIPAWLDLCRAQRGDPWRIVRLTFTLRSRRSPSSNRFLRELRALP